MSPRMVNTGNHLSRRLPCLSGGGDKIDGMRTMARILAHDNRALSRCMSMACAWTVVVCQPAVPGRPRRARPALPPRHGRPGSSGRDRRTEGNPRSVDRTGYSPACWRQAATRARWLSSSHCICIRRARRRTTAARFNRRSSRAPVAASSPARCSLATRRFSRRDRDRPAVLPSPARAPGRQPPRSYPT